MSVQYKKDYTLHYEFILFYYEIIELLESNVYEADVKYKTCTYNSQRIKKIPRFEIMNCRFITQRDETIAPCYVSAKQLLLIPKSS